MLLRVEAFGRVLHVEFGKADDEGEGSPEPSDAAYPMQVATPSFVGFIQADPTQPEVNHGAEGATPPHKG